MYYWAIASYLKCLSKPFGKFFVWFFVGWFIIFCCGGNYFQTWVSTVYYLNTNPFNVQNKLPNHCYINVHTVQCTTHPNNKQTKPHTTRQFCVTNFAILQYLTWYNKIQYEELSNFHGQRRAVLTYSFEENQ